MEGVTWKLTAVVVFDCGDSAIDGPPLDAASLVVPRCRSESKEAPLAELLSPYLLLSLLLSLSISFAEKSETLAIRRRAITAAPHHHCCIAAKGTFESTSSSTSPSLASRENTTSPESANYRVYSDRRSSSISPSPASL